MPKETTIKVDDWNPGKLRIKIAKLHYDLLAFFAKSKYTPFRVPWTNDIEGLITVFNQPLMFDYMSTHDDDYALNCVSSQRILWWILIFRLWKHRRQIVFKIENHWSEQRGKGRKQRYFWCANVQAYWINREWQVRQSSVITA